MEKLDIQVSIILLSYCHEKYIRQALDSIFNQKTELSYEVLIGDDASKDRTIEIIQEYMGRYPGILKPICRTKNVGASYNLYDLIYRAKGKYIALLEGDDFWVDNHKLQKQFDFLESHLEYIGCCSKCLIVDEHSKPDYERSCHIAWNKKVFTLDDLIDSWQLPGQLGTMMFRNYFAGVSPDEYSILYKAHPMVCDKTLLLFVLSQGPVYCCNKVLSAYRFVDKMGGNNWFSIHHANPYRNYDMFMYPCKLESWARKNLTVKLPCDKPFGKRNPYRFARFVEECVKKPERKKFQCLFEMIAHNHQPLQYSWYVLKALIEME